MKRLFILLAPLFWAGNAFAMQDPPKHIRVSIQYFSLPLRTLNELLAGEHVSDSGLHDEVFTLTKEGKAQLLNTQMTVCRSGEKNTILSIREEIYPTEYFGSNLVTCGPSTSERLAAEPPHSADPREITAFETRNTGATLEVEPTIESSFVNLRLVPEHIAQNGFTTWMEHTDRWGKADIRMPVFETWRTNTNVSLTSGKFALVSSITPKRPLPVPFVETRILLFVRADVLGSVLE